MIRILMLVFALVAFTVPAAAKSLTIEGLDEQQRAEILLKAAKMKTSPTDIAANASEWADIGQKYGSALVATGKELGIAADQLLDTTVGKVALVLIVWKVMGDDLLGVIVGVPYMVFGFFAWFYMFRRMCVIESVTKEPVDGNWFRKKTVTYHDPSDGDTWNTRWVMLFALAVVFIPAFLMIFAG